MNEVTPTMRSNGDAHSGFVDAQGLIAAPLTTSPYADNASEESKLIAHTLRANGVRRLTPLECERLQGFPDDHTRYGIDAKGREIELSDSARYFVCGNAVTSNVAEFIGIQPGSRIKAERPADQPLLAKEQSAEHAATETELLTL